MHWPVDEPAANDAALAPYLGGLAELAPRLRWVRTLRYVPGRRVTALVYDPDADDGGGTSGTGDGWQGGATYDGAADRGADVGCDPGGGLRVAKVFARPRARGNDRRLRALAAAQLGDVVPASYGADRSGHAGLIGWMPGAGFAPAHAPSPGGAPSSTGWAPSSASGPSGGSSRTGPSGGSNRTGPSGTSNRTGPSGASGAPALTSEVTEATEQADRDTMLLAGAALRRLHDCGAELDRCWTLAQEVDHLLANAPGATVAAARAVAARAQAGPGDEPAVPSHRDCHPGQLVRRTSAVSWVDLDEAAMAPPALDVGNFVAHLWRDAALGARPPRAVADLVRAFLDGYGRYPASVGMWAELSLARLAGLAESRHHDPRGRDQILRLLSSGGVAHQVEPCRPTAPVNIRATVPGAVSGRGDLRDRPSGPPAPGLAGTLGAAGERGSLPDGAGATSGGTAGGLLNPGHPDRPVVLRWHETSAVVHKQLASDRAAKEQDELLQQLWRSPAGQDRQPPVAPRPLGVAGRTVMMEALDGEPAGSRGDPGRSDELAAEIAHLLADLHRSGAQPTRARDAQAVVRSLRRKAADLGALARDAGAAVPGTPPGPDHGARPAAFGAVVERLATCTPIETLVGLSHGDFSPRNVLVTADGVRLIDFDRCALAGPSRDVTYWGAWRWATDLLRGQQPSWGPAAVFEHHYLQVYPAAAADLQAGREFGRAAALLRIAHGWSALRDGAHGGAVAAVIVAEAARWADRACPARS